MKKVFIILLLVITTLFAKEEIVWSQYNLPTVYELSGPNKGKGYEQLQENEIRKYLSNYRHRIITTSIARTFYTIKNTTNTCSGVLKNKKREKYIYFSVALNALIPNGLYIKRDKYQKFKRYINGDGKLDLKELTKSHKFKLAYKKTAAYGDFIDKYKKTDTLVVMTTRARNQLILLKNDRIDGYFTYPIEALKHVQSLKYNPKNYIFLHIEGSSYTPAYIGCSKSKFGKKVIKQINKYILKHRENSLLEHYLHWIDKTEASKIREHIDEIFKKIDKNDS